MKAADPVSPADTRRVRTAILVWAALTGLVFGGRLYSTDVVSELEVAGSFLGERPFLTAGSGWTVTGSDGRSYSPHGIGYPILLLPSAAVGIASGGEAAKVAGALTCSVFSIALMGAWLGLCRAVNGNAPRAMTAVLIMTGSMALVYSKLPFDVTAAAFLCTASLLMGARGRDAAAGAFLGMALLVRLDSLVFLPSLLYGWRRSTRLLPGIAAALLVIAAANAYRFGSIFDDGHSQDPAMFLDPGPAGLAGLLASPGKGLLWFAPLAFAAAFRHRGLRLALPLVLGILLHSQLHDWTGGTGWGPRFLFPALPAFLIPLAAGPPAPRRVFATAAAWSVLIAISAAWSNPTGIERSLGADAIEDPTRQAVIWQPSRSPLLHCLGRLGTGRPDVFAATALGESRPGGIAAIALQSAWVGGALALCLKERKKASVP